MNSHQKSFRLTIVCIVAAWMVSEMTPSHAEEKVDFQRDVMPILSDKCFSCHGPDAMSLKANLRLDRPESTASVLDSGHTAIVPGRPDESELVQRIESPDEGTVMPPPESNKTLSPAERDVLKQWIVQGAEYRSHWSFVAPVAQEPPMVSDAVWNGSAIDRFVFASLAKNQMNPSPEADRATLIRRVSLDLRGVPPTLAEVDAFLGDVTQNAYERMVDRMLASAQFGERMALIWLDLARYGDTNGYHADSNRPVWLWRDWVIDAYNRNMPFDQFTEWQLGGDLLAGSTVEQKVASGFNRNVRFNEEGGADPAEFLTAYAGDRAITMGRTWLGLTLNCAQCHSHKFDPISHKEFYQLTAFFNSLEEEGAGGVTGFHGKPVPPVMHVMPQSMIDELTDARRGLQETEQKYADILNRAKNSVVDPGYAGDLTSHIPVSQSAWEAFLATWSPPAAPVPDVSWDFRTGSATAATSLPIKLEGQAKLTDEGLVLDGQSAYAITEPLVRDLRSRTLEVVVRLKDLTQQGGAAITLQSLHPDPGEQIFDAIVFGERQSGHWMAGSNFFLRTDDFGGPTESEAHTSFIYVAIAYDEDGTIRCYRNGAPYGNPTKKGELQVFAAGESRIVFGARALPPGGNYMLAGTIREARLYERALTPEEVAASASTSQPPAPGQVIAAIQTEPVSRTPNQTELLKDFYLQNVHQDTRAALMPSQQAIASLRERIAFLQNEANHPLQMVSVELPQPRPAHILLRGDFQNPGEQVGRETPSFLPSFPVDQPRNRLGLARWLMLADQPLVARVQVNRFWQMLFGEGLVRSLGDFGAQGTYPDHPELLDWLALKFIDSGWDVKQTLRLILLSHTYRQASADVRRYAEQDPQNRLLWRAPRVRLPAELVRDNALFAAGLLALKIGGPPVFPYQPTDFYKGKNNGWAWNVSGNDDLYRRGLYTFWRRTTPYPTFVIFDAPDRAECAFERPRTNTPLQALVTLNDPQFVEAARVLAQRVLLESTGHDGERIGLTFRLVIARVPTVNETELMTGFLNEQRAIYRAEPAAAMQLSSAGHAPRPTTLDIAEHAAWTALASVVLNLDEAITRN